MKSLGREKLVYCLQLIKRWRSRVETLTPIHSELTIFATVNTQPMFIFMFMFMSMPNSNRPNASTDWQSIISIQSVCFCKKVGKQLEMYVKNSARNFDGKDYGVLLLHLTLKHTIQFPKCKGTDGQWVERSFTPIEDSIYRP